MRCNFRIALVIGCAGIFASSAPALSKPAPAQHESAKRLKDDRAAAQLRHVRSVRDASRRQLRSNAQHLPGAGRREAVLRSIPVSSAGGRPAMGWPALVTEARKYIGTNPTARKRLWCATFMNFVLAKTGYSGTGSDAAKSFASYGKRVSQPQVGAIAVLTRGKRGGHVGIVTGINHNGNPIIISGNHGRSVGEGVYSRARVIAYVMPAAQPTGIQFASTAPATRARASDAPTDAGLIFPITELLAAINAEKSRDERAVRAAPPVQQARQTPPPHERMVQQARQAPATRERPVQAAHAAAHPRQRLVQQMPQNVQASNQNTAGGMSINRALNELFGVNAARAQPIINEQPRAQAR